MSGGSSPVLLVQAIVAPASLQDEIDRTAYAMAHLFDGSPPWCQPIFAIALALILVSVLSTLILGNRSRSEGRRERDDDRDLPELDESDFLWVFVVPALNEEVTIADSVGRLAEVEVRNRVILVIDDGSDDRTGEILAGLDLPELTVLSRVPPEAREGKSEALNAAWRHLHERVLRVGRWAEWPVERVIFTIVDADGRLDPRAGRVSWHFRDPEVGGVQSLVRIYNRTTPLTWAQDVEFGVFGNLLQRGRMAWGTANMGGNGQFNRLAALDSVAVRDDRGRLGPWRAGRLTEDQDIGLRLLHAGWRGEQARSITVSQQGLNSLRMLYRQRTRWAQGGWQVIDLAGAVLRDRSHGIMAKLSQLWYLATPIVQSCVGLSVVLSIVFLITGEVRPHWTIIMAVLFYLFTAVPGIIGVLHARHGRRVRDILVDLLIAHGYLIYSWIIYPVVYRALFRQLFGIRSWVKTKREALTEADDSAPPGEMGEIGGPSGVPAR
ncbi:hypothetical protein BMH32_03580 [Leucobacter sp. OLJS4]|uniref:glycosyltransferase family 2 protein n=1 Tax=unclassified Leucobacter TaxID=2621730 RepID=UPI000C1A7B79|nr:MULTISPECIES: glycosyltransferase family 2 protein [unclassified Leucobacter]PII83240.1 hypothetical protein BMH25_07295 [Leucobacter sp. OLCALW19]PII86790.1 hypothetical protein BMH26_10670 [Leucobacter sp. OLTLW20]PII91274.1 hypothetical protein BMH27_08560 [Leucobacter sp. OLAS13]PII98734.1 hypothetical protein BMH29_07270 [Leucobacter sp. OLDS2]PIJ03952.1 hypothetical protein BMH31_05245 [Leucobacter sp. OLIS6]